VVDYVCMLRSPAVSVQICVFKVQAKRAAACSNLCHLADKFVT
jgi:hypothetical protein